WGIFYADDAQNKTPEELWAWIMLTGLLILIYGVNYYLGYKLFHHYSDKWNLIRPKKVIRIIFYCIEIIAILVYTYLLYELIKRIVSFGFMLISIKNPPQLIGFIFLITGYVSSLLRIIF